jgi:hypothetical protein
MVERPEVDALYAVIFTCVLLGTLLLLRQLFSKIAPAATDQRQQHVVGSTAAVREVYELPYPQHLFSVEHHVHALVSATSHHSSGVAPCIDSLLMQTYGKLVIWVRGDGLDEGTALLLETR